MRLLYIIGLSWIAMLLCYTAGTAMPSSDTSDWRRRPFAQTTENTSVPVGWVDFCIAQPKECAMTRLRPSVVTITDERWSELLKIDMLANHTIYGVADNDHYGIYKLGIINWWTYPDDGKGNCNDYVLLKKKLLVEAGWPASSLLLTVVLDHENEGHLVLTVRTDRGDLILDNMVDDVKRWNTTGYTFIKRQSTADPNTWQRLEPGKSPQELAMINRVRAARQQ
jgi:predicted transglutaminase-like cysteine proteinase